jgi:hypothetical protein
MELARPTSYNHHAIHDLPLEIVTEIFFCCVPEDPLNHRKPNMTIAPMLLCQICSGGGYLSTHQFFWCAFTSFPNFFLINYLDYPSSAHHLLNSLVNSKPLAPRLESHDELYHLMVFPFVSEVTQLWILDQGL